MAGASRSDRRPVSCLPVSALRDCGDCFEGLTSTCMKLPSALTLLTRICVPVTGVITLPIGLPGS